jgi:glycerol kinase
LGHVEHDPDDICSSVVGTVRGAMAKAGVAAKDIAGIGITNQRETTIVWDRATGHVRDLTAEQRAAES